MVPQLLPFQCSIRFLIRALPTAKQLFVLGQDTLLRLADDDGLVVGSVDQLLPFQCSASVFAPEPFEKLPTAKQLFVLGQDTAVRVADVAPLGFLGVTNPQELPFQCSAKVLTAELVANTPTAKQLFVLGQATPRRLAALLPPGLGLDSMLQLEPFQCSAKLLVVVDVEKLPTAKQLFVFGQATPVRPTPFALRGVATARIPQPLPFQCSTSAFCAEPAA
jgi:hypothetical protein